MYKIIRLICGKLEERNINRVNWLKTLYFNFRFFSFNDALKLPFYIYGKTKFHNLSGTIDIKSPIERGMVKINMQKIYAPSLQTTNSQIIICGKVIIRGKVEIGCGTKLLVTSNAILDFGKNVKITDCCNIDCSKSIIIGENSIISHRCQLMDSNHHYIIDKNKMTIPNNKKEIKIGKKCWICNTTTIMGGTSIPDFCIVGSYSLANKDFSSLPKGTLFAGIPAKAISQNKFRAFNFKKEVFLNEYFQINNKEYLIENQAEFDDFFG